MTGFFQGFGAMHRGLDFVAVRAKQRPQIIQIVLAVIDNQHPRHARHDGPRRKNFSISLTNVSGSIGFSM